MDAQIMAVFLEESAANLRLLEEKIEAIRKAPADAVVAKDLLRAAHTLHGNAASVGLDGIAGLAKPLESALTPYRDGEKTMDQKMLQLLHESRLALKMLTESGSLPPDVPAQLKERFDEALSDQSAPLEELALVPPTTPAWAAGSR